MSDSIPLAQVEYADASEEAIEDTIDSSDGVQYADGSIHYADGTIDHPDGTVEFDGYFFDIGWDELDPPEGDPGAEEIPHELVVAEICAMLGLPPGSL